MTAGRGGAAPDPSRTLAWSLCALAVLAFGPLGWLDHRAGGWSSLAADLAAAVLLVAFFVGLGTLLALRQPTNPIGWLLTAGGLVWVATGYAETLAREGLTAGGTVSEATSLLAILNENTWGLGMSCSVGLPLLLFPAGRLRSPRWRWVARAMGVGAVTMLIGALLSADPVMSRTTHPPTSVVSPWALERGSSLASAVGTAAGILVMVSVLIAVVGIALRFRSATGLERQQLRWVRAGALLAVVGMLSVAVGSGLLGLPTAVTDVLVTIGIGCVPMSLTVAVLRYRLYELDRVVSRTVTYAAVTGLLLATYAGLVTAVSRLTPSGGSLAVAASTLAVAALFQPLRRRVQSAVDRRFNRTRYDAERIVEQFRLRLRDEVALDAVSDDLLAVVRQTVQPDGAGLWLRAGRDSR